MLSHNSLTKVLLTHMLSCSPQGPQQGMLEGDFALCISLYHGYELLMQMGLRSLFFYIQGIMDGSRGQSPHLQAFSVFHCPLSTEKIFAVLESISSSHLWLSISAWGCCYTQQCVMSVCDLQNTCLIGAFCMLCLVQRCPGPEMSCRGLPPSWTFTMRWRQCLWSRLLVPEHSFITYQSLFEPFLKSLMRYFGMWGIWKQLMSNFERKCLDLFI